MSNLINGLMDGFLSDDSVSSLSRKAGADQSQVQSVIQAALPVMLQSMVNNTGDPQGAQSLDRALNDHAQRSGGVVQQVQDADTEDGSKILGHLLGGNKTAVESHLAQSSGLQTNQVGAILASLAPVLLSAVGKQRQIQEVDDGGDLGGSLMSMLTGGMGGGSAYGGRSASASGMGSIMDMFMGGGQGEAPGSYPSARGENTDVLSSLSKLLTRK